MFFSQPDNVQTVHHPDGLVNIGPLMNVGIKKSSRDPATSAPCPPRRPRPSMRGSRSGGPCSRGEVPLVPQL
eukprot:361291-Chlamydomonas_euryale.AAC.1